jgi:hypothetical protein
MATFGGGSPPPFEGEGERVESTDELTILSHNGEDHKAAAVFRDKGNFRT